MKKSEELLYSQLQIRHLLVFCNGWLGWQLARSLSSYRARGQEEIVSKVRLVTRKGFSGTYEKHANLGSARATPPAGNPWQVSVEDAESEFRQLNPDIVVIDPFCVGEPPQKGGRYQRGVNLARRMSRACSFLLVWTCLPLDAVEKGLRDCGNVLLISQGMTFKNVFVTICEIQRQVVIGRFSN